MNFLLYGFRNDEVSLHCIIFRLRVLLEYGSCAENDAMTSPFSSVTILDIPHHQTLDDLILMKSVLAYCLDMARDSITRDGFRNNSVSAILMVLSSDLLPVR